MYFRVKNKDLNRSRKPWSVPYYLLKIVEVAILIQVTAINAQAAGTCLLDKSDIAEDMQKITEKLAIKYGSSSFQKSAFTQGEIETIYDDQELKVDRSAPFLNQVNAVGVITDAPIGSQKGYASAVLISSCHVLTNAHAITKESARAGNSPMYISLGQNTCESKNEFAQQNIPGNIVALGDEKIASTDYAIVKIKNSSNIKPVLISTEYISQSDSLMMVGFPFKSTFSQKTGFRYSTANFSKAKDIGTDGSVSVSNSSDRAGGSGSGIFILDQDNGHPQVVLGGIYQGEGGVGIQTAAILKHLRATNPKIYKELASAIRTGSCN